MRSQKDISEVQIQGLTNKEQDVPDFSTEPWSGACNPYHTAQERWKLNEAALAKHCSSTRNTSSCRIYLVHTEDRLSKTEEVPLCAHVKVAGRDDRVQPCRILNERLSRNDKAKKNGSRNQNKCQSGVKG